MVGHYIYTSGVREKSTNGVSTYEELKKDENAILIFVFNPLTPGPALLIWIRTPVKRF